MGSKPWGVSASVLHVFSGDFLPLSKNMHFNSGHSRCECVTTWLCYPVIDLPYARTPQGTSDSARITFIKTDRILISDMKNIDILAFLGDVESL